MSAKTHADLSIRFGFSPITRCRKSKEKLAAELRGYHRVPSDEELRNMSDIELHSLLPSCKNNPVKFAAVEREIHHRKKAWYEKPIGLLAIAVIGGLLVACEAFYFGWTK